MRNKLIKEGDILALSIDQKSFFNSILGHPSSWNYKRNDESFGEKIINSSTIDKIHVNCDVIIGSVLSGVKQTIPFRFILDKPTGFEVICEPETIQYNE